MSSHYGHPINEVNIVKFNQMTDLEKRKLLIAMYFLSKGAHQLNRLHDEFSRRDSDDGIKESQEKESNLFQAITLHA